MGRDNSGDLVIDRCIILKWLLKIGYEFMEWICLCLDRVQWWAVVNTT